MAFCRQCGAYIADGFDRCPACGTSVAGNSGEDPWDRGNSREKDPWDRKEQRTGSGAAAAQAQYQREENQTEETRRQGWTSGTGAASGAYRYQYRQSQTQRNAQARQSWEQRSGQTGQQGSRPEYQRSQGQYQRSEERYQRSRADVPAAGGSKWVALMSYLGILCIIPLVHQRDSEFVRFHANQGLLLFLLEILTTFVAGDGLVQTALSIFTLACAIRGIVDVVKGRMRPLPIIGKINLLRK